MLLAPIQAVLPGGATRNRSDAAICASPSSAARVSPGNATPLSAKFFETMLPTPAWISLGSCPDGATHASQRWLAGKRFSPVFGTASRRCSDGVSHASRRCFAGKRLSPLDCIDRGTKPSTKAHSGAAASVQSGRVYVSIAILASDRGMKLLVELPHSASFLLPSLLAVLSVMTAFHAHVAAVLPANISDLSR